MVLPITAREGMWFWAVCDLSTSIFYSSHSCTLSVQCYPTHNNGLGQNVKLCVLNLSGHFCVSTAQLENFNVHFGVLTKICRHSDHRKSLSSEEKPKFPYENYKKAMKYNTALSLLVALDKSAKCTKSKTKIWWLDKKTALAQKESDQLLLNNTAFVS